jgi:Rho-binding antiterminator
MTTDYQPIACDLYSHYELAILRRRQLRLTWYEGNVVYDRVVKPLDLQTRNHAEYLIGRDADGAPVRIRLDRIRACRDARTGEPLSR